jgi:mannose-1-phosphate guanylyltransferase
MHRPSPAHETRHLWGIVLAGSLDGRRSRHPGSCFARPALFRQALSRAAWLIPPERLVAVLTRGLSVSYDTDLEDLGRIHRVVQPAWRGSAAETFLPVLKVAAADPEAAVAIFPGSQLMDGEARFMSQVAKAVGAVAARPDLPVVIGASPRSADAGCCWIEPGPAVEGLEDYTVRSVRRFVPRPGPAELAALWEGDGLVNTGIVVAKARALIGLGMRYLPDVLESFEPLAAAFGAPEEPLLSEAMYEQMPYAAFAHALFVQTCEVAVLPVTNVRTWVDRGAPSVRALAS